MKNAENLVVIHLSATAVYVVIGQVIASDDIRIIGLSEIQTNDFYQGRIIDHDALTAAIKRAVQKAEDMSNCRVHSIWLSLSTPELLSKNSISDVHIKEETITALAMNDALSQAKMRDLPKDYYLMHYTQQGISINNESMLIDNPIGTYASSIKVMYHLMMLPVVARQNIESLFRSTNFRIDYMIVDGVSGAEFGLIDEEKQQGVCYIDIGYSTTSVCVYKDNKLIFTHCLPHGGHEVTMDISAELGLSMAEAEKVKTNYGMVDSMGVDAGKFITFNRNDGDELTINLHELSLIIEARYIEIYKAIFIALDKASLFELLTRGVVLAGGASRIKGMVPFSKRFLQMPVNMANTNEAISAASNFENDEVFQEINTNIKNPGFQPAFGALLFSQSDQFKHSERSSEQALDTRNSGLFGNAYAKFSDLLKRIV